MGHARRGISPSPALGLHLCGDARQLVLRQSFQQRGVGQVHACIALREQVAADAAARLLVGVQPDEAHQRMPVGVNLALRQTFAQVRGLALPLRRIVERAFLRGVVVGDGERHQLIEAHGIGPVVLHQTRRDIGELQAALHHQRRNGEIRRNVLNRSAFGHQRGEGFKLVCWVHGFALHVLGQAGGAGRAIGHRRQGTSQSLAIRCFFASSLRGRKASATCHHLVMQVIGGGNHDRFCSRPTR